MAEDQLLGKFLATALVEKKTGEVVADAGAEINQELLDKIKEAKINEIKVLYIDNVNVGPYIRNTLEVDKNHSREDALLDIYRVSVRANRLHTKLPTPCSNRCSSTTSAMICLRSAA